MRSQFLSVYVLVGATSDRPSEQQWSRLVRRLHASIMSLFKERKKSPPNREMNPFLYSDLAVPSLPTTTRQLFSAKIDAWCLIACNDNLRLSSATRWVDFIQQHRCCNFILGWWPFSTLLRFFYLFPSLSVAKSFEFFTHIFGILYPRIVSFSFFSFFFISIETVNWNSYQDSKSRVAIQTISKAVWLVYTQRIGDNFNRKTFIGSPHIKNTWLHCFLVVTLKLQCTAKFFSCELKKRPRRGPTDWYHPL